MTDAIHQMTATVPPGAYVTEAKWLAKKDAGELVILPEVEVFKAGNWNGGDYDSFACGQVLTSLKLATEDPDAAKVLGIFGGGPLIPILDGHRGQQVGYVAKLAETVRNVLIADLAIPMNILDDIAEERITAVSARVPCARGVFYLAHVALVRPPDVAAVHTLRPIKENLPKEYRHE